MAAIVVGFGLHHFNLLCTGAIDINDLRHDTHQNGPDPASGDNQDMSDGTRLTHLFRALYIATAIRGIDTRYEIKNLANRPKPSARLSRSTFLVQNLAIIAAEYLVLDLMFYKPLTPEDSKRLFPEGSEYLFFRPGNLGLPPATAQDALKNLAIAFFACGPTGTWYIELQYRVVSVISVALGISTPQRWPNLFGSITETYTLRQFWGTYWHQLFRWPMTNISSYICRTILRLPRPSLLERYTNILVVFIISAFLHAAMDARAGFWPPKSGAFRCFLLHPVGIMIEDAVQEIHRRVQCKDTENSSSRPKSWQRIIGYVWVWGFMMCVMALYTFPLLRYQNAAKNGVPVSVVKLVEDWVA
ncbi:wax synthase family protein [Aspergillus lucknowensis]|uniref:Membrane bound O-acyl transferase family-domain-containing protein n=1 Tax=Aspergillus lucknowensis TaxID=176173 RepID=A0ABR4LIE2_9EURO